MHIPISKILVLLALLFAAIATIIGFGWIGSDDPHLFGWLSLSLAFFFGSLVVP